MIYLACIEKHAKSASLLKRKRQPDCGNSFPPQPSNMALKSTSMSTGVIIPKSHSSGMSLPEVGIFQIRQLGIGSSLLQRRHGPNNQGAVGTKVYQAPTTSILSSETARYIACCRLKLIMVEDPAKCGSGFHPTSFTSLIRTKP